MGDSTGGVPLIFPADRELEEHFGAIQKREVDRRLAGGLRVADRALRPGSNGLSGGWALKPRQRETRSHRSSSHSDACSHQCRARFARSDTMTRNHDDEAILEWRSTAAREMMQKPARLASQP